MKKYDESYKYKIEYIGLPVTVVKSTSKERIGIKGYVIDERKNIFVIEKEGKESKIVKIPKKGSVFRFTIEGKEVDVDGSKILFRPEERLKKL